MKSFIFILLSALFLGSAAYLGNMFLFEDGAQPPVSLLAPTKAPEQYALSLTRPVKNGNILEKDMLMWRPVPEDIPAGWLLLKGEAELADWSGAVLTRDLPKGAFLEKARLVLPTDPEYMKALLTEGMRARPVAIDNAGEFGDLRAGDHIDLILTYKAPAGSVGDGETVVKTILESVRVVGTGTGASGSLTLALSPADVELVSVAETIGRLKVSLRGETNGDAPRSTADVAAFSASDLFPELKSSPRPVVQNTAREVRIFRGGETKVLTLTGGGQ